MNADLPMTLVAAVNDRRVLAQNLLASPALRGRSTLQLIVKEGASSASAAYDEALDEALHDIVVFVHQDVVLPAAWFRQLEAALRLLDAAGAPWGVLGCFGSRHDAHGGLGRVYTHGLGVHGNAIASPVPVDTLDEIVLVLRKSSGLRFDRRLPHFHLYGVDICMTARIAGLQSYAIPAFCVHNTNQLRRLPAEFYVCYGVVKRKWDRYLPIAASCLTISRGDIELRRKRREEFIDRLLPVRRKPLTRVSAPGDLLAPHEWAAVAAGRIPERSSRPPDRQRATPLPTPPQVPR